MSEIITRFLYDWLMYLRKSRQDDPNETVEEVLAKHEAILQEHAARALGGLIPPENIYREVCSGEKISEREEIKKVLARIEDPNIKGVLVVEPSRLSRGDLNDCGKLMQSLKYTNTLVVTPMMTYDLSKKMEHKFLQGELLRGNDYLEYTKEVLWRGREAAAKRGCYPSRIAPYGYDKIKVGKDPTLVPNGEAETLKNIFHWVAEDGLTIEGVARRLNDMGILTRAGKKWIGQTIYVILNNPAYIGKVRFNYKKEIRELEQGELVVHRVKQRPEDVLLVDGLHPALVSEETFNKVQALFHNRAPRVAVGTDNPLAGLIRCKSCGMPVILNNCHKRKPNSTSRYNCTCSPCCYKSAAAHEVYAGVLYALEHVELPQLRAKLENSSAAPDVNKKRLIAKLERQEADYRHQEDILFERLETGRCSLEEFDLRSAELGEKMKKCRAEMRLALVSTPKRTNYEERIASLEKAIEALKNPEVANVTKNTLLRAIVDRIEYSSTDGGLNRTNIQLDVFLKL